MVGLHAAVLLFCIAGQLELNGLGTVEVRGGQAPLEADGVVRWGVVGIATPDVQASYLSRRLDLRLDYAPRIFWRKPNDISTWRPLVLHVGNFAGIAQVTRRFRLTGVANASVGETDYTTVTQYLPPGQAALPSVVDFLSITTGLTGQYDVSRLSNLSTTVSFIHRRPRGATADVPLVDPTMPPFPRQTTVAVAPAWKQLVSRTDELTLSSVFSYGTYSGGTEVYTAVPQAAWLLRMSSRYDLRLAAGVAYAHLTPARNVSTPLAPVGEVGLDMRLAKSGGAETRASITARMDYFVDPVLSTAGPRAVLVAGFYSALNPDWLVAAEAGYATVFVGNNSQYPALRLADETVVYANLPVRYRTNDHLQMEFGFRYADRGPSVEVDAFGFHQRQLWLYYLITGSTRRPTSRKVQ